VQEGERNAQAHPFIDAVANGAAHENGGQRSDLQQLEASHFAAVVAGGDVGDFMRHHARHLRFFIGGEDQAGIHIEESTGQRHGVNHVGVDHFNGERNLGVGVTHQVLPNTIHVFGDDRVVDDLGLPLNLLGEPLTDRNLFFE